MSSVDGGHRVDGVGGHTGLSVACYDPAEDPCEKFILVDEAGHNAGFATYVEELATALFAQGARWFPRRRVASVAPRDPGLALTFASGAQATAEKTILNIPQRPLLEIMRGSPALGLDANAFAACRALTVLGCVEIKFRAPHAILATCFRVAASARWRGDSTLSTRCCPRDRVGSMAWRLTKVHA